MIYLRLQLHLLYVLLLAQHSIESTRLLHFKQEVSIAEYFLDKTDDEHSKVKYDFFSLFNSLNAFYRLPVKESK